jgi:tetratricopeptide (TPR) repeat protein
MIMQSINRKFLFYLIYLLAGSLLGPSSVLAYGNVVDAKGCSSKLRLACAPGEPGELLPVRSASLERKYSSSSQDSELPTEAVRLKNLAEGYEQNGDFLRAESLYLQSMEVITKTLGMDHPIGAFALINLADLYIQMEDYRKAEPLYLRSLGVISKSLGPDHFFAALAMNNIGGMYKIMGEYDKAEMMYLKSLNIHEKSLGTSHPNVAIPLNNLAELYRLMGEESKAEPYYLRARKIFKDAMENDLVE